MLWRCFLASIKGVKNVQARLKKFRKSLVLQAGRALVEEAQVEQKESMKRTPVDTGALRASHETSDFTLGKDTIEVSIKVGGASAPYAVAVHEDLSAFHKHGQAKFLESVIRESAPHMASRVSRRLHMNKAAGS
jgi:hypothetical protein